MVRYRRQRDDDDDDELRWRGKGGLGRWAVMEARGEGRGMVALWRMKRGWKKDVGWGEGEGEVVGEADGEVQEVGRKGMEGG